MRGLQGMHHDARDVLVLEIVCDAVYNLFFGGFWFTYNVQKSGELICSETSQISDIVSKIRHRLGYLPELAKTEPAQRNLVRLLTVNNLAFSKTQQGHTMPAHGVSSTHNTWHTSARWSAFFQTFLQASRRRVPRGSAKSTTGFRTRNRSSWRACSRRCVFLKKGQNAAVYHDISDLIQTNTVCRLRRLPLPSVELKISR